MRALRRLPADADAIAGDEVTTEYGEQFGNGDTENRRDQLQRRYGFECHCVACDTYAEREHILLRGYRCSRAPNDPEHYLAGKHSP